MATINRYRPNTASKGRAAVAPELSQEGVQQIPVEQAGFDPSQIAGGLASDSPAVGFSPYGGANNASESQTGLIDQADQNRESSNARGDAINNDLATQANNYAQLQSGYRGQADAAANALKNTPGYNDTESRAIGADFSGNKTTQDQFNGEKLSGSDQQNMLGNSRSSMAYYNPNQLNAETSDANAKLGDATQQLQSGLKNSFDPSQLSESSGYANAVNGAVNDQNSGINASLGAERSGLNAAVDPSKLSVDGDYASKEGMTAAQQADIVASAGTSVGNQYQASKDALQRNAAAEGNTSPAAIAAASDRLNNDSAAKAGDAMTDARIAASNAAAAREQTIQGTKLGANQDLSSRQMSNAQTMGQQGVNAVQNLSAQEIAANQALENTRLGANQDIANRAMTAANVGGQAGIQTAQTQGQNTLNTDAANQKTGQSLEGNAEAADTARLTGIALNNQQTQQQQDATKYNQGMATQAANSQGQQTLGNARIAGNNSYLNYNTGQQAAAQTGQTTATGQQIQNYGTQAGAANTATQTASQAANTKAGQPSTFDKVAGGITAALSAPLKFLEDGGVATRSTVAMLGEHGPEQVVPLDQQLGQGLDVSSLQNSGEASVAETPLGPASGPHMNALQKIQSKLRDLRYTQQQNIAANPHAQPQKSTGTLPITAGSGYANLGSAIGSIGGAVANHAFMEDGGIATQPTPVMLGENGPEQVVPLGGQQSNVQMGQPLGMASQDLPQPAFNGMAPTSQGMPAPVSPQPQAPQPTEQAAPVGQDQAGVQQSQAPQTQTPQTPPASGFSRPPRYPQAAPAGTPDPAKSMPGMQTGQPQAKPPQAPQAGTSQNTQPQRYASGGMITRPTLAIIGEHGPEAVVPMNPSAQSKLTPGMLAGMPSILNSGPITAGPMTMGPQARARYRHPTGSAGNHGPMHALNILRPSMATR